MGQIEDLTGRKFGRLTVVEYAGSDNGHGSKWKCICDCGSTKVIRAKNLKGGVHSCGCLNLEKLSQRATHGKTNTRIYRIWKQMRHRCHKPYSSGFVKYGRKGISVCDEWRNSFQAFYDWAMANGYTDELTIDRIDNAGNYEPSNCRWASIATQANNKSNNRHLTFNGKTQTIAEWSDEVGIRRATLYKRISDGWTTERALTTKVR